MPTVDEGFKVIDAHVERMAKTHHALDTKFSANLAEIEETKEFVRACAEACELDSLEEMIEKRDQLVRYWREKRETHASW